MNGVNVAYLFNFKEVPQMRRHNQNHSSGQSNWTPGGINFIGKLWALLLMLLLLLYGLYLCHDIIEMPSLESIHQRQQQEANPLCLNLMCFLGHRSNRVSHRIEAGSGNYYFIFLFVGIITAASCADPPLTFTLFPFRRTLRPGANYVNSCNWTPQILAFKHTYIFCGTGSSNS